MKKFFIHIFFITVVFCLAANAHAQKQFNVMDWKTDASLNTWLRQQMHAQYDQRRTAFHEALRSKKAMLAYGESVRAKFRALLGPLPGRTPLQAKVTGRIKADGYYIEKIIYESFPHHHVTADLYLPDAKGKVPAALLFCGHEDAAKATPSYQRTAMLFARNGFAVLVIDPISQSERYQLTDGQGKPRTRGGTTEHTLLNAASNLCGGSTPADELWDNVRGLDYLLTRPEIDTAHVGCLGNSGGAMQTLYFAAFDPRVKVFAPCSYLSSRERTLELDGPADGCAQIPGEGAAGLEFSDYLIAAAPKPVLVLAGRFDFIDYTGTQQAVRELQQADSVLGAPHAVALFTVDDGHGISQPKREAAVAWFRKWLCHDGRPLHETPLPIQDEQTLRATTTGQVSTTFPDEVSLLQRNMEQVRNAHIHGREEMKTAIRAQLVLTDHASTPAVEQTGTVEKDRIVYEKMILRREGEVPLPVLVARPSGKLTQIVVWLPGEGKNRIADSTALVHAELDKGNLLVLADLRGIGETEDRAEFNDPKYYNREYRNAMLSLHIGRPIVGQRVTDIQTIMDALTRLTNANTTVVIRASGRAALPALYACVLDKRIGARELSLPLRSFTDLFRQPTARDWYSYVVPGVLRQYDIDDLERWADAK